MMTATDSSSHGVDPWVLSTAELSSGAWRIVGGFQTLSIEHFLLVNVDLALISL